MMFNILIVFTIYKFQTFGSFNNYFILMINNDSSSQIYNLFNPIKFNRVYVSLISKVLEFAIIVLC